MGSFAIKASLGARGPGGAVTLTAAGGTREPEDTEGQTVMGSRAFLLDCGPGMGFVASSSL